MSRYPDHLNTTRLIQDQSGNTVWRWDQGEPFGNDVPNNNPSGAGAFDFPLRFPGQYFDRETNLSYNYYRDYDPAIGAYKQSDPMSVGEHVMRRQARLRSARGTGQYPLQLNSYLYVNANPLRWRDPSGRDFELVLGEIFLIAHEGAVAGAGVTAAGAAGYGLGTGANYLCGNCFGDFGIWIYNTSHPDPLPLPQAPDPLAPLDPLQIPQAPDPLAPLVPLPDPLAPLGPPAPPVSCRP